MTYVSSSRFTIKLNGGTEGSFISPKKGLRQGYPLSSYLFILEMEVLFCILCLAQKEERLDGVRLTLNGLPLTHNFYADDVILFERATEQEAAKLKEILENFGQLSGRVAQRKVPDVL
jgi:Reverse transcriptase (RNA-dependent DNA polymerase)